MFQIKSLLISFYTGQHFFLSNQFWIIIGFLTNKNHHNIINWDSQITLPILSMTLALVAMVKTLVIFILFFDFNLLDYNIFQVIHCDDINGDQILEMTNISRSSLGTENDDPSFVANNPIPSTDIGDNSWAMTTIRPSYSPNAIENFSSDVETIPDGVNTNLRSRRILRTVIFSVGGCVLAGIVIVFSVLGSTHSL
jgi:hypothetical protein